MLFSLESSLIWVCLTSIPIFAGLVDVTPHAFNRRHVPESAVTSAAVNSTPIPSIRSASSTEQLADTRLTSTLSRQESYATTSLRSAPGVIEFQKECMLWDGTCADYRTAALEAFFNQNYTKDETIWRLIDNNCFVEYFPYPDDASSITVSLSKYLWSTPGRNQGPCPEQPPGNPRVPTQQRDSKSRGNLQPQNIKPGSPGKLNPRPVNNSPRLVTFAGTAQNKAIDPGSRYQSFTIRPIESSTPIKQLLPVPVATIANQPVITNATGEGYQTDSTAIKPDGVVVVFLGISVVANLAGEFVAGDKIYAPLPSELAEPIRSTIDVIHEKISRCYILEGPVFTAGVAVAIMIGSNGGRRALRSETRILL